MKELEHSQVPNSLQIDQLTHCRDLVFQAIHKLLVIEMTFTDLYMCPHWPSSYQKVHTTPQEKKITYAQSNIY